jgi:hypothetical protein
MNSSRRGFSILVSLVIALGLVVPFLNMNDRAWAEHVQPTLVPGNPNCDGQVPGTTELLIQPVEDGTFSDGTLVVVIDVRDTSSGQVFDFSSNIGVDAVIVKGGPNANLYVHNPEITADTGLHAPAASAGLYWGLSLLFFCYDVQPPTATPTDTPTNTATNTPTDTPTNTATNTPTDTPTNSPTNTATNTPTDTPTNTATNTPTDTPTNTATNTPTNTPTSTATPTNTPIPLQGCTPGYWKQSQHLDSWLTTGFSPSQTLESVFDVPNSLNLDNATLLQALNFGSGKSDKVGASTLLRSAVAALLNSAHPEVDYPRTTAEVIAEVNAALASGKRARILALAAELEDDNRLVCPLN